MWVSIVLNGSFFKITHLAIVFHAFVMLKEKFDRLPDVKDKESINYRILS